MLRYTQQTLTMAARRQTPRLALSSIGLVALLLMSLSACGFNNNNAQVSLAKNQIFTWPYLNNVPTMVGPVEGEVLDPAVSYAAIDSGTLSMIYNGLVTFDSGLNVVADAATPQVDTTGTIYTFHLRHNMRFSDGSPLTADDYAYSIDRALDPALCVTQDSATYGPNAPGTGVCSATPTGGDNPPLSASYLGYILGAQARLNGAGGASHSLIGHGDDPSHGVDVIDQYTLRIRLSQPVAFFLEALTYPTSYPVERSLVQKYPGGKWVDHLDEGGCSGPFKVKSYGNGKEMIFTPNPYWSQAWGKNLTITEVHRPLVDTDENEYTNYRAGQYDYTDVPAKQYSFARGQNDFYEEPTLATNYFGLNFNLPPFDKLEVRQAFDLALNKQLLVDRVLNGGAIPTNHIVPRGMPGFNENLKNPAPDSTQSLTGNQDAAKQLLQQAVNGCSAIPQPDYCAYITGPKIEIDLTTAGNSQSRRDLANAATQAWSTVLGLNVKPKFVNSLGVLYGDLIGNGRKLQMWSIGWLADYPDPQDWLSLQFHSGGANNVSNVNSPDLDALMDKADREQNPTLRMQEYNQIEQQAVNLCAWIPFDQAKEFWRQRSWVHGFSLNPLGSMVDINWPNVYITQH